MPITTLYAGLLGILFMLLSWRVVAARGSQKINLGDGGNPLMLRRIRGHANFAEYVPLILVLLALLEMAHLSAVYLHVLGATLLLARVLHGYALSFAEQFVPGRFLGTLLSFIVLVLSAGLCVYSGLGHALP